MFVCVFVLLIGKNFRPASSPAFRCRLHLVGRLLAALSFGASSGVFLVSVVITSMSWLFLLWLRVHSLALQEVTGSIHVAVCFLFPYSFK